MDRPTKIVVGPLTFSIIWDSASTIPDTKQYGHVSFTAQELHLCEGVKPDRIACTFAHEVAHLAYWYLGEKVRKTDDEQDIEEDICDLASYSMITVWRQNPQVFNWWVSLVRGEAGIEAEMKRVIGKEEQDD